MTFKEIVYDWGGANGWLFKLINHYRITHLDPLLLLLAKVGDHHNFPYYFIAIALIAVLAFVARKIRGRNIDKGYIKSWAGLMIVLIGGYVCMAAAVGFLKAFFAMPRPFIVLGNTVELIGAVPEAAKHYASFPSGHAAFMAFMITAIWPKLYEQGKTLGAFCILLAAYARVALGLHFPVDVVTGVLIGITSTIIVRRITYRICSIPYY